MWREIQGEKGWQKKRRDGLRGSKEEVGKKRDVMVEKLNISIKLISKFLHSPLKEKYLLSWIYPVTHLVNARSGSNHYVSTEYFAVFAESLLGLKFRRKLKMHPVTIAGDL